MRAALALLVFLWTGAIQPERFSPPPAGSSEVRAQAIEVPYRGLRYSVLTRGGVTIMIAPLDRSILEYWTAQVWVSNGSPQPVRVSPQAFSMRIEAAGHNEPITLAGTPEGTVLSEVMRRARSRDMTALVRAYETVLFGFADERAFTYYQRRKEAALAGVGAGRLRAAATASAILLAEKTLRPSEFVDGTVFFRTEEKHPRITSLTARIGGNYFEFPQPAAGSGDSH